MELDDFEDRLNSLLLSSGRAYCTLVELTDGQLTILTNMTDKAELAQILRDTAIIVEEREPDETVKAQ